MMYKWGHPVATLPSDGVDYTSLSLNDVNSANHRRARSSTHPPFPQRQVCYGSKWAGPDEPDQGRERHGASCRAGGTASGSFTRPARDLSRQTCPRLRGGHHSLRGLGVVWEGGSR
eukprot:6200445-Pleurochrysis_carterae.AAC.2